jgi:hypothetical protein
LIGDSLCEGLGGADRAPAGSLFKTEAQLSSSGLSQKSQSFGRKTLFQISLQGRAPRVFPVGWLMQKTLAKVSEGFGRMAEGFGGWMIALG